MKIRIFQSSHGDCLMLESAGGTRILCDGGMPSAMRDYVAPALDKLRRDEPARPIDLLYVSHIDGDHIGGVLELLENEMAWKIYDYHREREHDFRKPDVPRSPPIRNLWHNAFRDQVEDNVGRIEDLLAAAAPALLATRSVAGVTAAMEMQQIALGVDQALRVSKLAAAEVLDISINKLPGANAAPRKLLMTRDGQGPIALGDLAVTIVGPTETELKNLRKGWNNWLEHSETAVKRINREIRRITDQFAQGLSAQPIGLYDWEGVPGFRGVTVPNLASLVLHVREGNRTVLLTGDAQHDVLEGHLRSGGFLDAGHLHLDVLKVQHHGSEKNMSPRFARTVSADHYIFCGDGSSGNPEPDVLDQIFDSRMSDDPDVRAVAPQANDGDPAFHFWFSTSKSTPASAAHYRGLEKHVTKLKQRSHGRLKTHYNKQTSITLSLP
jgi:hypothetical protein